MYACCFAGPRQAGRGHELDHVPHGECLLPLSCPSLPCWLRRVGIKVRRGCLRCAGCMQSGLAPMQGQAIYFLHFAGEKSFQPMDRYVTETKRLLQVAGHSEGLQDLYHGKLGLQLRLSRLCGTHTGARHSSAEARMAGCRSIHHCRHLQLHLGLWCSIFRCFIANNTSGLFIISQPSRASTASVQSQVIILWLICQLLSGFMAIALQPRWTQSIKLLCSRSKRYLLH